MPKGEYLLQTAAGSTIGRQIIAVAKLRGVKTINVIRRKEQAQELLDIGCALPPCHLALRAWAKATILTLLPAQHATVQRVGDVQGKSKINC